MDDQTRTEIEAAAFRRLQKHLMEDRPDVQNIDLMNMAGFCRNCLSRWYQEAANERGLPMTKEEGRAAFYGIEMSPRKAFAEGRDALRLLLAFPGMPYDDWKAHCQPPDRGTLCRPTPRKPRSARRRSKSPARRGGLARRYSRENRPSVAWSCAAVVVAGGLLSGCAAATSYPVLTPYASAMAGR